MCGRLSAWTLAATAAVARAHNGVVHEPNTSSAVLVGPSIVCGDCFVIMNYGKNYIRAARATAGGGLELRDVETDRRWMPLAAVGFAAPGGAPRALAVSDVGQRLAYTVGGAVIDEAGTGCPPAEVSKFYRPGGAGGVTLFSLMSGMAFTLANITETNFTCTHDARRSWSGAISWEPFWQRTAASAADESVEYTESPLFYAAAWTGGCNWFLARRGDDVVATSQGGAGCANATSPALNDGCGGQENRNGGDFFVHEATGTLHVANGESGMCGAASPACDDSLRAGKILRIDGATGAATAVACGLGHPWSAVATEAAGVFIADVGSVIAEEVSRFDPAAGSPNNFGWPVFEGNVGINPLSATSATFTDVGMPVYEDADDNMVFGNAVHAALSGAFVLAVMAIAAVFFCQGTRSWWQAALAACLAAALSAAACPAFVVPDVPGARGGAGPFSRRHSAYRGTFHYPRFVCFFVASCAVCLAAFGAALWVVCRRRAHRADLGFAAATAAAALAVLVAYSLCVADTWRVTAAGYTAMAACAIASAVLAWAACCARATVPQSHLYARIMHW